MAIFSSPTKAQVQVYAAASLTELVGKLALEFKASSGVDITVVTAGTSILAQQIVAGAPADIFVSANKNWIEFVQEERGFGPSTALFGNSLIVVSRAGSDIDLTELSQIPKLLGPRRLALGDPGHVPAGIYARQALEHARIWDELEDSLAPTSNVRTAVQLVRTGAAPLGIVYASDGEYSDIQLVLQIEENAHEDIVYWGATGPDIEPVGEDFFTFLQGARMKQIALELGFKVLEGK